jgi:hypothetical protein
LDCKLWPAKDEDAQRVPAKALCGFSNAEGGVIVIGLEAKGGPSKYDPDTIRAAVPVADAVGVKSRIESLIGDLVEPRIEGVRVAAVIDTPEPRAGFVVVAVPASDGLPCRSRKHHEFYQRISSGTYPMEYFQIADMFGKRHRPELHVFLEEGQTEPIREFWQREFILGIENRGRAVAKFPSIRFDGHGVIVSSDGIDGNGRFGLPRRPTEPGQVMFGGGADDVIYPNSVLKVAVLIQRSETTGFARVSDGHPEQMLKPFSLAAQLSADGVSTAAESKTIPGKPLP